MRMFGKKFGKSFDTISRKDLTTWSVIIGRAISGRLRHVIERAVLLSKNGRLVIPPLDSIPPAMSNGGGRILPLKEMEARHILKALAKCNGKVSGPGGAAELLEIKPTTLYSKMKRLGLKKDAYRQSGDKA
jgi:formate hydrogenlyase transcriptional activator